MVKHLQVTDLPFKRYDATPPPVWYKQADRDEHFPRTVLGYQLWYNKLFSNKFLTAKGFRGS